MTQPKVIACGEDNSEKLPLLAITSDLWTWEWVVDHLPKDDSITQNIQSAIRAVVESQFPCSYTDYKDGVPTKKYVRNNYVV